MRLGDLFRLKGDIANGAAILACLSLIASGMGFLRDQAFSIMFPIGSDPLAVSSVYIAAFRPSDLLFQVLVMSTLSVVLVPLLSRHLASHAYDEMHAFLVSVIGIFSGVFCALALFVALLLPYIAESLVSFRGEQMDLYIRFARFALCTNALFVIGNALGQYLITRQKFWVYGITPIIWALGTIIGTYALSPILGADGPIIGTILGTIVYCLWRLFAAYRLGFRWKVPRRSLLHEDLRSMGLMIIPRMIALGALQLQLLLLDRYASMLPPGLLALNQFARNFESVIPGIVGIAIAQSSFSLLSISAARGDVSTMKRYILKGILFNVALSIPGAIALALLSSVAAWMLQLSPDTTPAFIVLLLIYACAIPWESVGHVLLRGFYAKHDTRIPAVTTVASCITAVATAAVLLPRFHVFALAIGYVAGQIVQTALLSALTFKHLRSDSSVSLQATE